MVKTFITWLSRNGFRVRTKLLRRYEDGTTKANLDMELAIDLLTQAPHIDVAIIVSGDGDFRLRELLRVQSLAAGDGCCAGE